VGVGRARVEKKIVCLRGGAMDGVCYVVVLQDIVLDKWVWKRDHVEGYSVRGAYQILTLNYQLGNDMYSDVIWNKVVAL